MNRFHLILLFACAKAMAAVSPAPDSTTPPKIDSVKSADTSDHSGSKAIPSHKTVYGWPLDSTNRVCRDPLEIPEDCWRNSPLWLNQVIGFPGARSRTLSLSSLEPAKIEPFFQPTIAESPYGLGGHMPFDRVDEGDGKISEVWTPVLPLDTPITSLHWERGALQLNQFTLNLRRMVGDRTYLGLQIHSDNADSQFYQYSFNVHQPYLAGWGLGGIYSPLKRDSASLVIQDTSQKISAFQIRPRLGFWIDSQTVIETYVDWLNNTSSLANPTNPGQNDSAQLLYPVSFSASTGGVVAARFTQNYLTRVLLTYSNWTRDLYPNGDSAARFAEQSSGTLARLNAEETFLTFPGRPRIHVNAEQAADENVYWLHEDQDQTPAADAQTFRAGSDAEINPSYGPVNLDLIAESQYRNLPDSKQENLFGSTANTEIDLPWKFKATGGAGWTQEGAPEDALFRWQPALGLYPNPELKPRTDLHLQAGGDWEASRLGFGASWERHQYENSWEPRILPKADVCVDADSANYPSEHQPICASDGRLPDSLALALVNYHEEIRDLLHVSMFLRLGNWRLSLLNTYLVKNAIQDDRLGFTGFNSQLPKYVFKGQLLWHRKLFNDKLDAQTQWDWEWTSTRYVYASDLDGYSRPLKLDEYLDLDFTARMEIKTFMLYFRVMNLNHDRYATEAGVHPPGVNFRFGIDWRLWN